MKKVHCNVTVTAVVHLEAVMQKYLAYKQQLARGTLIAGSSEKPLIAEEIFIGP